MKKCLISIFLIVFSAQVYAADNAWLSNLHEYNNIRAVKTALNKQINYANKTDFNKFISTYSKDYVSADGYDIETYSKLVKDLWNNYDNIKYGIKIKDIEADDNNATVTLVETSQAHIPVSGKMNGELLSKANSIYYLKKINGKWKVTSDCVIDEVTSMLYGEAMDLDISLSAPQKVTPGEEYCATLKFIPPKDTFAIASIAKDKVEYPQKQVQEVFRKLPDDNILERLFTANSDNANEYVIASIGLTRADIKDLSIKLSLTGFGYQIIRVNVMDKTQDSALKTEGIGDNKNVGN